MEINRHYAFVALCFKNFKVITLSGAATKASTPVYRPWRRINTLYSDI